ncbi:MAG: glycosyltransferase family 39 protein [Candidatus Shapirobacteria bacterium]|nr:glycosyltransferase family 39 protein [Candidatus Shapirobacteria bacterium]
MIKKSFKFLIFISIIVLAFFLRKKNYAQIPIPGQSVDEYSYSWVGLSLIKTGMPIGVSGIPGYQNQFSKYINVDRLYQTLSSDPLSINYPWMDHPPLLGLITGGYAAISGANVFEDTTSLLIRRPIIIISTISVALLMIFCWLNFRFLTAVISGSIYATTPLIVLSSRMIQAENAIIPCLLLVMIFSSLYFRQKKDIWLIFAAIISGIATLFKLTGVVCHLYIFFSLIFYYQKFNSKLFKDFLFFLGISLPITSLFFFYGISYGSKNFFNILFSNANRFYGIGPNAIIDLIRNQRLTQHKFLPEIWLIIGWITFFLSFSKTKKTLPQSLIFISLISYLIVYLFFGSQPYGWYTFPFWPLLILSLTAFFDENLTNQKNLLLTFIIAITIFGANLARIMGIFEFQKYSTLWRFLIPATIFFLIVKYLIKKPTSRILNFIILALIFGSVYFNLYYLNQITLDFWWQNIS